MKTYVFPGQGSQFSGMGKDLYESSDLAKSYFDKANEILGFEITKVMFEGTDEELKQTKVTQPAIFLHSVIKMMLAGEEAKPEAVAGHSLGEFSALVASKALSFEDGLRLVAKRAEAMQKACEIEASTMAAIVGLEDEAVEKICAEIDSEVVIPANYNCPGQLVISGSVKGIELAVEKAKEAGARMAIILQVGGAFHSPFMAPAQAELKEAIEKTTFSQPVCPIYQNVDGKPQTDPATIKNNLNMQLTAPVKWTQTMQNMIADGANHFVEVGGNGKVIRGFIKRIDRKMPSEAL